MASTSQRRRSRDGQQQASSSDTARTRSGLVATFGIPGVIFLFTAMVLLLFGIVMIYSASSIKSLESAGSSSLFGFIPSGFITQGGGEYVVKQSVIAFVGIIAACIIIRVGFQRLVNPVTVSIVAVTLLLLLTLTIFLGVEINGAKRWFNIGPISFQASEFAKISAIVVFSLITASYREGLLGKKARDKKMLYLCIFLALVTFASFVLVMTQPDLGTTLITVATLFVLYYAGGGNKKIIVGVAIVGALAVIAYASTKGYSSGRIANWLNQWGDPSDQTHQLDQGYYAFASGGFFGVGIGMGRQKYFYLPEAHNDSIFAVIGEECGLIGTAGVVFLFGVLGWTGLKIARKAPSLSARLVALGCSSMFVIQMLVNITGILGLLPQTGKPLPFLSYGGSSILATMIMCGLVLSVARESSQNEVAKRRRKSLRLASYTEESLPETSRQSRPSRQTGHFTVLSGGANRINLGRTARDRLRGESSQASSFEQGARRYRRGDSYDR